MEIQFAKHLAGVDLAKVKKWYNGYKWLGEGLYNPFDILLFISKGKEYESYWFSTATPTFLLKIMEQQEYFLPDLESISVDKKMLDSFDVGCIDLEILMWQTGYLTIVDKEINFDGTAKYILGIPNQEIRLALMGSITDFLTKNSRSNTIKVKNNIYQALITSDFEKLEASLKALFASIAYDNFEGIKFYEYEGYYVSLFYAYIKALGIELINQDHTNKGRIDITIKLEETIYVIEFKVDGTNALQQIKAWIQP